MARQRLGQHFLTSARILERIAEAACPQHEPLVIEIGPGKGDLTERLLARAGRVIAVEIDPKLAEHLRLRFAAEPRLSIVPADALETDLLAWGPGVIAGNLPYYAATPIIERVAAAGAAFRRAVFLIQKEVAGRLTAVPGTREYGFLTLKVRLFADCEQLFDVKPSAFRPPPKVNSTVVRLHPRPRAPELGIDAPDAFLRFISLCFRYKRKTLRNNLTGSYPIESIQELPHLSRRAEQLLLAEFAELYHILVA